VFDAEEIFRTVGLYFSSPSRIAGSINIKIVTSASLVAASAVVLLYFITMTRWHQREEGDLSSQSLKHLTGITIVAHD